MRRAVFGFAVLACWSILVLWAAQVDWSTPFSPHDRRDFPGDDFNPVFGTASRMHGRLHVESTGADDTALESLMPANLDAEDFPTLRYRFGDFPRTLELSLVFRTAENPEDTPTISLPWPGDSTGTFDLSRIPAWRGRIIEIGFAQFPTALVVPPDRGFKPFELAHAALWSPSWRGDLAALATDWFSDWPWTQRSVHALGRDTTTPRAVSIVLCAAIAAAIAIFWRALLFGWRDRRWPVWLFGCAAAAWILLDVCWQAGLWGRVKTTRAVYAGLSWEQRERTVADTDIADAANELAAMLRGEPPESRILVYAGSAYELLRFIWHALPLNVGDYPHAEAEVGRALPEGCFLVFFDSDAWRTNPALRRLLVHSERVPPPGSIQRNGFENDRLVVFRFHHGR